MYATCLFCNKTLGANEALESFPVGKRLAFDAAKGRLWVVCPHCERWNLSPLEERWEAIEQSERLYRDSRQRVATDNIGLAKLRDGTTLVRIGEPLRPEFAAWRYGDQFGRRRRRQLLIAGGGLAALGAVVSAGAVAGVGLGAFSWMFINSGRALVSGDPETVVAKVRTEEGRVVHVRRRHLGESSIGRADDGTLAINLRYKHGQSTFVGREAERIASIVIPKVNRFGGSKPVVASAVREIESAGGAEGYLERLALVAPAYSRHAAATSRSRWSRRRWNSDMMSSGLFGLPQEQRIALEMALHEEAERRAIQGELGELERAWREAEEIAGIADSLLLPEGINSQFERMRKDSEPQK